MKVSLIGSAYMADDDMPHLIVSYRMFDELSKNPQPIEPEFYAVGETAEKASDNIFKSMGMDAPRCPKCYEPADSEGDV